MNKSAVPKKESGNLKNPTGAAAVQSLHHLAFGHSLQANLISTFASGQIVCGNKAALQLLGYSKKELLTKTRAAIFDMDEAAFAELVNLRSGIGKSTDPITTRKKDGSTCPCLVTSAVFVDEAGIQRTITTISDMSEHILNQMNIDIGKAKLVNADIRLAISQQKIIDIKKEKIVADDIINALEKSDAILAENTEMAEQDKRLKEMQFADAMEDAKDEERSDIGKELHDNITQLLGASRMYMDMGKRGGLDSAMYLSRASEYTMTAIEEIRLLTKRLTTDIIKNIGLCDAIENLGNDMMEVTSVKIEITCSREPFNEQSMNEKFKHNAFRIVQEQLNNVFKHSGATNVKISLSQNNHCISLVIADNGIGFDTGKKRIGIGIKNIKSRAAAYDGSADFISAPGLGCVLTVQFPVTDKLSKVMDSIK